MSGCNHEELLDLARGDLSPARAAEVEDHAETCASCAHELRWLRTERALFRGQRAAPASHVWQGIERRLVISLEERRSRRQRWVQVGGAGTVLAAAASAVLFLWGRGAPLVNEQPEAQGLSQPAPPSADDRTVAPEAFDTLEAAEAEVKNAITRLERVYTREKNNLDPEEVLRFEEELQGLKQLLSAEKATAKDDVWARRRVLRAYSTYMRTMQAMVLEVRK